MTFTSLCLFKASLIAQLVKNPPAMQETWVRSLGREDTLEKGKAAHPSILAGRIPWTVLSMGSTEPLSLSNSSKQQRPMEAVQTVSVCA